MIKLGSEDYREDIYRMCELFHKNSPYGDLALEEDKVHDLITSFLQSGIQDKVVLLACDPEPVGILVGVASEFLLNRSRISGELCFWVDPGARQSRHALELISYYEYWSDNVAKCQRKQVVALEGPFAKVLDRWYRSKGYRRSEIAYIKEN